jgi:hypothetical protein
LNETRSKVRIGKDLSGAFPVQNGLKQGDALSSLLFNFALEYAIKRKTGAMELNRTHQLLVYADVHLLRENLNIMKRNAEVLIDARWEVDLEVNAAKTKYMF